jgi:SAM-dependent MidA family methyltransferase
LRKEMLEQIIREKIKTDGPITFETFMDLALYHPEFGYYMTDRIRIGPRGDFYTSPHMHPIFGWLLANQLDEIKQAMGNFADFTILEIGAGRGYLAAAILDFIQKNLKWKGHWKYVIVESNLHTLKDQKRRLKAYEPAVTWKTSLSEVKPFCGCIVTNELLDAFPVHLVRMDGHFQEIYLGADEKGFIEVFGELSSPVLSEYIRKYNLPAHRGYRTEINLKIKDYLKGINEILLEGFMISIDFGYSSREYYLEARDKGTLLCYYQHKINDDPYMNIGRQDITAHINFSALKDWGSALGIKTIGYCPQGTFLASLGIDEIVTKELEKDPAFELELLKIKDLLFDTGESHQVMIQYKGKAEVQGLRGFKLKNRINKL